MDPNQQPVGRARGRGRALYQHPPPFHAKEPHLYPRGEPYDPAPRPANIPPSLGGKLGMKQSSSDDSPAKGRGHPKKPLTMIGSDPTKRTVYPDARVDNVRGVLSRKMPETLIRTRPEQITSKVGTTGQKITCEANYFRLIKTPDWFIYRYHIDFRPDVPSQSARRFLVNSQRAILGGFIFDGTQLYLVRQKVLEEGESFERTLTLREDPDTPILVTFRLTGIVSMTELQSLQILNLILRRAMDGLHLETVGRNKFDPDAAIKVPSLRLDIWPGYITSIRQHEEDILVCAEISHKIMRNEKVYDIIRNIQTENRDFKNKVEATLLGMTVLTRYNNKTYRIDEITYDTKPSDTFKTKDQEISFIDYYQKKYNLTIRDPNQPMLISNLKKRDIRAGMSETVLLIPELCYATGLTDEMRSNFRTMREISQHTKVGPAARIDRLLQFNRRLTQSRESSTTLAEWDLGLDPQLVKIPARVLPYPDLVFGNGKTVTTNVRADWTSEFRNNSMAQCINLNRWYVICPVRVLKEAQDFISALQRAGQGMQFTIAKPRIMELQVDNQTAVSQAITECANQNPQLIMCVVSNNNGDRYATIKKRCYLDHGLPSQVMVAKTITPKDKTKGVSGLLSVATKVAIQMNAKLGGLPWLIHIPVAGLMTFGYDVCHDPKNKSLSWGALVATMDLKKANNQFFSAVNRHKNGEELSNDLKINITRALRQFMDINGCLPERILLFRDGVGDGQIAYVKEHEVASIESTIKSIYEQHNITNVKFMYVVVTKRVNTRIFFNRRNPDPGTCVDDVITLPERYDFFLVSQSVREGTVSPTGFNIIHDTIGIPPDRIQQLSFRFTYLYYNWSGTVRVPALCQYAHKLAFLASQSMQASPTGENTKKLQQTLYFL